MNLIERIDDARRRWNVLDHPFYLRWERGELTRDELAFYAGEYRHAVVALADAAALGGDPEHAAEERSHVALWDDFAAALEAPLDRKPTTETKECVTAWQAEDSLEARAILYAVESSQPDVSQNEAHRPGRALRLQQGIEEHGVFRATRRARPRARSRLGEGAAERASERRRSPARRSRTSIEGELETPRRRRRALARRKGRLSRPLPQRLAGRTATRSKSSWPRSGPDFERECGREDLNL